MKLTPDDDRISAYLDGELSPEERAAFEAELATSPEVRHLVEELGGLKQRVNELPAVGVKVNLAPEILKRIEAHRPGSHQAGKASENAASQSGSTKLRFGVVGEEKSSTTSWYSKSHRAMAMMIGSLAVVVVAVGTTIWWQAEQKKFQSEPFNMDFGIASTGPVDGLAVDGAAGTSLEMNSTPMSAVMLNRAEANQQFDVDPNTLLAQVPSLNSTKKWAETTAAPEGEVVSTEMSDQRVVANFYIQNTSPTNELIPVEVYCASVPETVRLLETALADNGIAVQNNLYAEQLAQGQNGRSRSNYREKSKDQIDSKLDGVSTTMTMRAPVENPAAASAATTDNTMAITELAEKEAEDRDLIANTENGEFAVYVDAPASQVLRFLADTEKQQDVSKLMFNNNEPVYVVDNLDASNAPAGVLAAEMDLAKNVNSFPVISQPAESQLADAPAPAPQNSRMMKSMAPAPKTDQAPAQPPGVAQDYLTENKAERATGMAGVGGPGYGGLSGQTEMNQLAYGQATWVEVPRQAIAGRDSLTRSNERRQFVAPMQNGQPQSQSFYTTPMFDNEYKTRAYNSATSEPASSESLMRGAVGGGGMGGGMMRGNSLGLGGSENETAAGIGGFGDNSMSEARFGTTLSSPVDSRYAYQQTAAEPRWRVLLILKSEPPLPAKIPPPPAMPESAN